MPVGSDGNDDGWQRADGRADGDGGSVLAPPTAAEDLVGVEAAVDAVREDGLARFGGFRPVTR